MGKKISRDVVEQEARALSTLLGKLNRAEFGRSTTPRLSRALIHQHESADRPISLESAQAYIAALNVPLRALSPRLADQVEKFGLSAPIDDIKPGTSSPLLKELRDIALKISDAGLNRLIERAEVLAERFPRASKTKKAA